MEDEWFDCLINKVHQKFNRIPRGGWTRIKNRYNDKFGKNLTEINVKNLYKRKEHQITSQRLISQERIDNESGVDNRINAENQNDDDSSSANVPFQIKNNELYTKIRQAFRQNIEQFYVKKEITNQKNLQ